MLTKIHNYFFEEDAELSESDAAVLGLMGLAMALAVYALVTMWVS